MLLLANTVRDYAWGSVDGMVPLVGSLPSGGPEAELWVGTHPAAPSTVVAGAEDAVGLSLAEVIARDPARWLGADLAAKGLDALPFLLKVLAVGAPLSLQAHPSADQAEVGFAREEAAGIAPDAPTRTYRDPNAKPEALVAIAETWALCGFREAGVAAAFVAGLGVDELSPLVDLLRGEDPLEAGLGWLLRLEADRSRAIAAAVVTADSIAGAGDPDPTDPGGEDSARAWVAALLAEYPDHALAVTPLLLQVVRLEPGDAVHLPAGNMHSYLLGAGVEVMAASDNVLRGGLTPKHVDVDELLSILSFDPGVPPGPRVEQVAPGVVLYDSDEVDFGLVVVTPGDGVVTIAPAGPSLLLATGGPIDVAGVDGGVTLAGGLAAYATPDDGALSVSGPGTLWWAMPGDAVPR